MNNHASQVIAALGGTAAVASLCEVSMPSVSNWKKLGIPYARMMFLRLARPEQLSGLDLLAATTERRYRTTAEILPVLHPETAKRMRAGLAQQEQAGEEASHA